MSKVKIQGNASGTGVLTVTAPNTSTDRVITLPDGDVTLGAATPSITDNGNATAMTITSDEKIGIGTASPAYALHIDGTSLGGRLMLENTANGNTGIFMKVSNSGTQVGNSTIRQENNGDISIYQGTTSEALRATLKQGGGICFNSDTAAANALDDYEEGTWTVGFQGATVTNNYGTGIYTKIGNVVYVTYYTGNLTISSSSGAAKITGLPFTVRGGTQYSQFIHTHGTAVLNSAGGHFEAGGTKMQFVTNNATANSAWVNGSGKYTMVSGFYYI